MKARVAGQARRRTGSHVVARAAAALVAVLLVLRAAPGTAAGIDWEAAERDAVTLLQQLIRIDTSNPPGNELEAANFLATVFEKAGIEARVHESEPGRASVQARLPGTGGARPLLLLNHLDVVAALAEEWAVPPFSGELRDGYVYGRGALDCKGIATVEAMVLLLLKRHDIRLQRDIIFLGTAGEETGGQEGAGWFVAERFEQIRDVEFVLNEGGHVRLLADGRPLYEVAVVEKTPCWLRLKTSGAAGHGSTPPEETAVTRLVRALDHVVDYRPPLHVTPEAQAYYAALAETESGKQRERYRDIRAALADPAFRDEFLQDPRAAALVHHTITPTVFTASQKTNVIPQTASADLDCRLLPGENPADFVRNVKAIIDDADVEVEILLNFPPSSSSTETPLFEAIRAVAGEEGATVVPSMLTGFTDSHYFREKGIASYGFIPFDLPPEERQRMHGIDERISTKNLRHGVRRLLRILRALDAHDGLGADAANAR
jgi:acetylornithine deacetylase/succinyl-diaminopimelate desuccinylase-like protein